jgi:hypothetical protein
MPAPSHSLLYKVSHTLESILLQDIPNDTVSTGSTSCIHCAETMEYSEYLRAAKNLLRWNLIWQSLHRIRATPTQAAIQSSVLFRSDDKNENAEHGEELQFNDANPLEALQQFSMLRLYSSHLNANIGVPSRQEEARYATLCLLHATYHNTIDPRNKQREGEQKQSPLEFLVQDLSYLQLFCKVMLNVATTRTVQLANLRLLHNLLVSLPSFVKELSQYKLIDAYDEHSTDVVVPLSNINTVQDLLQRHLDMCTCGEDGGGDNDRQQEVVNELTRILYILRAGRIMDAQLLQRLLLQPESRLLAIMLLTDTPTATVMNMEVQSILLDTFEAQVSVVVDQTLLGSESASALTPVLMLFNNLCQNHVEFRQATRRCIFPNPIALSSAAAAASPNLTKLSPADAPPGSLRNKCIRLLTWTESHTKRWMAELLWILCDGNAEEYVQRVGLGNAMPLLHARGLMELPSTAAAAVSTDADDTQSNQNPT